jgi:hypothetical protein
MRTRVLAWRGLHSEVRVAERLHPGSGSFGSLRGIGSIAVIAIEPKTGACVEGSGSFRVLVAEGPWVAPFAPDKEQLKCNAYVLSGCA